MNLSKNFNTNKHIQSKNLTFDTNTRKKFQNLKNTKLVPQRKSSPPPNSSINPQPVQQPRPTSSQISWKQTDFGTHQGQRSQYLLSHAPVIRRCDGDEVMLLIMDDSVNFPTRSTFFLVGFGFWNWILGDFWHGYEDGTWKGLSSGRYGLWIRYESSYRFLELLNLVVEGCGLKKSKLRDGRGFDFETLYRFDVYDWSVFEENCRRFENIDVNKLYYFIAVLINWLE